MYVFFTLINFLYQILQLLEVVLCYVICCHTTTVVTLLLVSLTLLHISSNTTVAAMTLVVFILPNDIGNLYDRSTFKLH